MSLIVFVARGTIARARGRSIGRKGVAAAAVVVRSVRRNGSGGVRRTCTRYTQCVRVKVCERILRAYECVGARVCVTRYVARAAHART